LGPEHPDVAIDYNGLGAAYQDKGDYDRAISYYEKALAIRLKALSPVHPDVASSYNNLGLAYNYKGDYDRAISYYEKALAVKFKALGPGHPDVATSYNNLGGAYDDKGDYSRAISYFKKALAIRLKALGSVHPDVANSYNNLGGAYDDKGDYSKAISYFEKALAIDLKALGPVHPDVATSYNNLGAAYHSKGDYDRAISCFEKALAIIKKTASRQLAIGTASNIGLLYMKKKQYVKAKACFQDGIEVIEKARLEMGAGKSEFMGRNIGIYLHALQNCVLMGDSAGAFQMAEMLKERGFLDRLSLSAALNSEGIEAKDRVKGIELAQGIESITLSLQAEFNKPESKQDKNRIIALSSDLEAKEKEFTSLEQRLMHNERYRNLRRPSVATLKDAQALCDEGTAILKYVIWEGTDKQKQSYCLVITKNGIKIIELARDFAYSKTVGELRKAIINKKGGDIDQKSSLLYARLIEPLEGSLKGIKRLIIVPDGALAFLPFDALMKKGAVKYLGDDYVISLNPSVSVIMLVKKRNFSPKRNQFLAFGGAYYSKKLSENRGLREGIATFDTSEKLKLYYARRSEIEGARNYYQTLGLNWPYLPGTLEEVNTIESRVFDRKSAMVIRGSEATEVKVKQLSKSKALENYRIVHFACHGYYDQNYPSFSSVIFSEVSGLVKSPEDGYLSVEEAALLNFNADIVNLSACETGLGKIVQGDGVIGLTRAFNVAGANRVGVTLWTVDDKATMKFMIAVYEKVYKQGKTYIEAYTETKREFRRSKQYNSPYYWSPFVLYGQ
jgi:CHAT domain-containing protein/Tfp pilus assembly protein PilF